MANRGLTVTEYLGLRFPKLVIPAFTRGKTQLDPEHVEETRGITNVRTHVKGVIGLLRRKYTTLEGTLLTDFLICNSEKPSYSIGGSNDNSLRCFC